MSVEEELAALLRPVVAELVREELARATPPEPSPYVTVGECAEILRSKPQRVNDLLPMHAAMLRGVARGKGARASQLPRAAQLRRMGLAPAAGPMCRPNAAVLGFVRLGPRCRRRGSSSWRTRGRVAPGQSRPCSAARAIRLADPFGGSVARLAERGSVGRLVGFLGPDPDGAVMVQADQEPLLLRAEQAPASSAAGVVIPTKLVRAEAHPISLLDCDGEPIVLLPADGARFPAWQRPMRGAAPGLRPMDDELREPTPQMTARGE